MNTILPPAIRPGRCTRRRIESAVTDLPLPDSPTRHSVSPASTWKLTSMTAGATPAARSNTVVRCSTESRGPRSGGRDARGADGSFDQPSVDPDPRLAPRSLALVSDIDLPVLPEHGAHRVGNLADGGVRLDGGDDGRHEVIGPARRGRHGVEGGPPRRLVARRSHLAHALDLARLHLRIDLERVDRPTSAPAGGIGDVRWLRSG